MPINKNFKFKNFVPNNKNHIFKVNSCFIIYFKTQINKNLNLNIDILCYIF